ncbi:hypothetical protein ACTI_82810 [Actinoplanes sp. OR16]|nr:hypothetical protein ACTI_82810 [Actinoplanes sp. OR16]
MKTSISEMTNHSTFIDFDAMHDKGLTYDLPVMSRRRMLTAVGGAALVSAPLLTGVTPSAAAAACAAAVGSETAGPYPADGSNGPKEGHEPRRAGEKRGAGAEQISGGWCCAGRGRTCVPRPGRSPGNPAGRRPGRWVWR